jgi:hypothetical protein
VASPNSSEAEKRVWLIQNAVLTGVAAGGVLGEGDGVAGGGEGEEGVAGGGADPGLQAHHLQCSTVVETTL